MPTSQEMNEAFREGYEAARADAAILAERCASGVAIQIGDLKMSLGIMCVDPCQSQRQTANAIAAAIRNLKS